MDTSDRSIPDVFRLVKLWILADMYSIVPLQNAIIKMLYDTDPGYTKLLSATRMKFKAATGPRRLIYYFYSNLDRLENPDVTFPTKEELVSQLDFIYANTMSGSNLRRLMIYGAARFFANASFEKVGDVMPREMLWDVMAYLGKRKSEKYGEVVDDFLIGEDGE